MADNSSSPATADPNSHKPEPSTLIPNPNPPQQQQHPQPLDPTKPQIFQPGPPPYAPPQIPGSLVPNLPPPPQFRPGMQFNQVPNFQNPIPPPGSMPYQSQPPPNAMRPFTPMPNGYPAAPPPGGDTDDHRVFSHTASLIEKRCKASTHFYASLMLVCAIFSFLLFS
ncbi:hypothetical protein YC2023_004832 [Brassica napus]